MALRLYTVMPEHLALLCELFVRIQTDPAAQHFNPHPFTEEEAERCCSYTGKDFYGIAFLNQEIVGYGMLRGWDEGHAVPSLGIYLVPEMRGKGLSKSFMRLLHAEAKRRGASVVRLKVYASNKAALNLYRSLGYSFDEEEASQMVGHINLAPAVVKKNSFSLLSLLIQIRNLSFMRKTERFWMPLWRLLSKVKNRNKNDYFIIEFSKIEHAAKLCPAVHAVDKATQCIVSPCNIPIVTSIAPNRIKEQKTAISTWIAQGFTPVSINYNDEIENLAHFFPEVRFLPARTDSYPLLGKKRIFINELLFYAVACAQQNSFSIAGIVNSDVSLYNIDIDFLMRRASSSLVFSRRVDVETFEHALGVPFNNGFDAFFFNCELLHDFPQCNFALGEPWWDIAIPLWDIMHNRPITACFPPLCFHVIHEINWSYDSWVAMGRMAYNIFEPLSMSLHSPYPPFPDKLQFTKTHLPPVLLVQEFCKFSTGVANSVPNVVDFRSYESTLTRTAFD